MANTEAPAPFAVVVALAVGALLVALALFYQQTPRAPATDSSSRNHPESELARQRLRTRAFVEQQVAAHAVVLFVDTRVHISGAAWTHGRALLAAVVRQRECVVVVDLATVAQGQKILEALKELRSEALGAEGEQQDEFLFVRGALVGDYARVRELLIAGALEETLAGQRQEEGAGEDSRLDCDFSAIRVDAHSAAGFIVLGPLQCFQEVRDEGDASQRAAAEIDPLLETQPMDAVDELLSAAREGTAATAAAKLLPRVPLAERARNPARRSKLLVCHDMQGGYLGDRFTQGSAEFDAYRFYQWDLVDLFVYFGHHLVCIPPVGWIAAGHRNGVQVLGAVVTEGSRGVELSAQIFKDKASAETCARKLAAVAALYGFDGYLVNVENDVAEALVPNVLVFLRALRAELRASNPAAQVIWYASLARSGERKHQARLDVDGAPFFACVDGLFTDYGWAADDAKFSAAFDLDRRFDVYMGVDVFGRHDTLGGGKLNSGVALRAAWNAGVSAALFAPGWTHECLQHEAGEDFVASEHRFWTAIRESWKPRSPCFSALGGRDSLYSAFNVGRGKRVWVDGVPSAALGGGTPEWSNLLEMDQQPAAALHAGVTVQTRESTLRAQLTHDTAFQGGSSVSIQGNMSASDKAYVKLFDIDIELSARHVTEISYTSAQTVSGSVVLLVLTVCPGLDRPVHQVILRSEASGAADPPDPSALSGVAGAAPGRHFYAPVWTRDFAPGASDEPHALAWTKKTYRIGGMLWDQKHIVEVGVLCTKKRSPTAFHACIGEVCVASARSRTSAGAIAAEPVGCVAARARAFRRLDDASVAFRVEWAFSAPPPERSAAPAQHVLVYLCDRSTGTRVLLGKSFGVSFCVARCPWPRASRARCTLELESVSWCGARVSAGRVCSLHLEEEEDARGD